jgi:tetratricopeptide (TPR) repeat protein
VYRADVTADRMFANGLMLYRNNQLFYAEQAFENAIKENDRDARYWYFLGLSRLALGNNEQAVKDFKEGAEREKRNLPGSAIVDRSLERLPMDARQTLAQYRKAG